MKQKIFLLIIGLMTSLMLLGQTVYRFQVPEQMPDSILKFSTDNASRTVTTSNTIIEAVPLQKIEAKEIDLSSRAQKVDTYTHSGYFDLSHIPQSYTINKQLAVGEIPISQSYGSLGELVYTIPIDIPASPNGLLPQISLSYNSNAKKGLVGMGWNISGISYVSEVNPARYYDDLNTTTKSYVLDGIRLLAAESGIYTTEHGKIKVQRNGMTQFKASYPNGSKAVFGDRESMYNSQFPIQIIEDYLGNKMEYKYTKENDVFYISEIVYGGNVTKAHHSKIVFVYEDRNDSSAQYGVGGNRIDFTKKLTEIRTYHNQNLIQTYLMNYESKDQNLFLKAVNCISGSEKLNPLKFYYGENNVGKLLKTGQEQQIMLFGEGYHKFANGKTEYIRSFTQKGKFGHSPEDEGFINYPAFSTYAETMRSKNVVGEIIGIGYGSVYDPTQKLYIYPNSAGSTPPITVDAEEGFIGMYCLDTDGDGLDEVIKINSHIVQGAVERETREQLTVTVYKIVKDGTEVLRKHIIKVYFPDFIKVGNLYSRSIQAYHFGDFLGIGKQSMLITTANKDFQGNSMTPRGTLIDLDTQTISSINCNSIAELGNGYTTADFDGDGRTDILVIPAINENSTTIKRVEVYSLVGNSIDKNFQYNYNYPTTRPREPKDPLPQKEISHMGSCTNACKYSSNLTYSSEVMTGVWLKYYRDSNGKTCEVQERIPDPNNVALTQKEIAAIVNSEIKNFYNTSIIDLNGDGKADLAISPIDDGGSRVIKTSHLSGNCRGACQYESLLTHASEVMPNQWFKQYNGGTTYGNCDILEIVEHTNPSDKWTFYVSTGKDFIKKEQNIIPKSESFWYDINGDGLTDLNIFDKDGFHTYTNNNGRIERTGVDLALKKGCEYRFIAGVGSQNFKMNQFLALSIEKNAQNKVIHKIFPIQYSSDPVRQSLLTGVVNSKGVINMHTYQNISDKSSYVYQPDFTGVSYPYRIMKENINLLSHTETFLNDRKIHSHSNTYKGGIIECTGRGFLGFKRIDHIDSNNSNLNTKSIYDPYKFGIPISIESPTTKVSYKYNTDIIEANKESKIRLLEKKETDKLKDISITTAYTYDPYGNALTEIVNFGEGIKSITTNSYTNHNTTTFYKLGELANQTIKNERGTTSLTSKISITYNAKHQPSSKKDYYNNNLTSEEVYVYDANNNLIESKSKAFTSPNWLSTKYIYDTLGRISRETDIESVDLKLFTDYIYNTKGQLSSTKDQKGLETNYEYDIWGRLIKTIYPDGTVALSSVAWNSSTTDGSFYQISSASNQPTGKKYFDALGRETKQSEIRFDGKEIKTDTQYDEKGRILRTSLAYTGASPSLWNSYTYDAYNRITTLNYASGKKDTCAYNKNSITKFSDSIPITKTYNAIGEVLSVTDPAGNIVYNYRPDGQLTSIVAPGGATTSFEYDIYGRQTAINDPSAGKKTYVYNAAGNISKEIDADLREISMTYDTYNRLKTKTIDGAKSGVDRVTTTITYNIDGLVSNVSESNGVSKIYTYDSKFYDRIIKERDNIIDGKWLEKAYTYLDGNIASVAYKSSESSNSDFATKSYKYSNGHLKEILLGETSIWRLDAENNLGIPTQATTGSLTRTYGYDTYGQPTTRVVKKGTVVVQNFGYNFNAKTGNLNWRKDNTRPAIVQENFSYDNLNRLIKFGNTTLRYDQKGNLTDNTAVAKFEYNIPNKPYQMTTASPYGNNFPLTNQTIAYNAAMRPTSIVEDDYTTNLIYNSDGDRIKTQLQKGAVNQLTRYYIGGQYEIDKSITGDKERLYLDGDAYSASAVYIKEGTTWNLYYILRDYLGSITHITDASGTLKQEYSYDPWGRMRNPQTQELYTINNTPTLLLGRGFTGHEHMTEYGLINMNARLYDPLVGRFLSPDSYVQAMYMSQNFNRYSYVLNNPLRYTDESGEAWHILVGAIVGGVINTVMNIDNIHNWGDGFAYFGIGAGGGALIATGNPAGLFVGGAFTSGGDDAYTQWRTNGFVNWDNVGYSATIGGATTLAGGYLAGKMAPYAEKWFANVGNKVVQKGLTQGTTNAMTGSVIGGATGLVMEGDLNGALKGAGKGAALGFGIGFGAGAGQQIYNNWASGNHWWTGKTSLSSQIEQHAESIGIRSGNKDSLDPTIIDKYYQQMKNHDFNAQEGVGGFRHNGKLTITEGNHKLAAAMKYSLLTGDGRYHQQLMLNGNITNSSPSLYGHRSVRFKIKY